MFIHKFVVTLLMLYTHINNLTKVDFAKTNKPKISKGLNVPCSWPKGIRYMFSSESQNLLQKNIRNIEMGSKSIYLGLNYFMSFFSNLKGFIKWEGLQNKKTTQKHSHTQI